MIFTWSQSQSTWQDVGKLDDSWRMEDGRWDDGGARSKKHRKNDALLWVLDLTDVNDVIEAFVVEFLNIENVSFNSFFISYCTCNI